MRLRKRCTYALAHKKARGLNPALMPNIKFASAAYLFTIRMAMSPMTGSLCHAPLYALSIE